MDAKRLSEELARMHAEYAHVTERLRRLEERVERLEREVDEAKRRPSQTVERIEYRFDQLKIDTLQGTLHIGIRPDDAGGEPIWSVAGADVPKPTVVPAGDAPPSSAFLDIRSAVSRHLHERVPPLLLQLSEAAGYDLDPEEMDRVVADLGAQVDARIAHYMKVSELDSMREPDAYAASVTKLTIRDVDAAIRNFVAGKRPPPPQEEESHL